MGKKTEKRSTFEKLEDFYNSDSASATATKFILGALIAGPLLFVGAALPGIITMANEFDGSRKYSKKQFQNSFRNLKYRKLIEIIQEKDGKVRVQLTNKGKKRIKEFQFENLSIAKPKKWDGKWRILIFDIPSRPKINNQAREALRGKIKELEFYQMQKSVWVYPYECEDEILLIAEVFGVQKHIEIITAEKLLHEGKIKHAFGL
ncbi:MAG TPA: hypothetical protein VF817_03820 [Patescibacteria group bacterium]